MTKIVSCYNVFYMQVHFISNDVLCVPHSEFSDLRLQKIEY